MQQWVAETGLGPKYSDSQALREFHISTHHPTPTVMVPGMEVDVRTGVVTSTNWGKPELWLGSWLQSCPDPAQEGKEMLQTVKLALSPTGRWLEGSR